VPTNGDFRQSVPCVCSACVCGRSVVSTAELVGTEPTCHLLIICLEGKYRACGFHLYLSVPSACAGYCILCTNGRSVLVSTECFACSQYFLSCLKQTPFVKFSTLSTTRFTNNLHSKNAPRESPGESSITSTDRYYYKPICTDANSLNSSRWIRPA